MQGIMYPKTAADDFSEKLIMMLNQAVSLFNIQINLFNYDFLAQAKYETHNNCYVGFNFWKH